MKIAFIGAGNVAYHLAQNFDKNGHTITDIFSRNINHARALCQKLYDAKPTNKLDLSHSLAEVVFICLPDDALIYELKNMIFPSNAIVLHTSGSVGMDVFENTEIEKYGVFYPLQTFSKFVSLDMKFVPICLETSDENTEKIVEKLAFSICENIAFYDSEDRKKLHLAAVFACNFTNHLYAISYETLEKNGLSFELLKPLIQTTTQKALQNNPRNVQTGPAIRNDKKTMNEHLEILSNQPNLALLYEKLSENIFFF